MRCRVCGLGPMDGVTVFRQNAKGQPGVWACGEHAEVLDDVTAEIVAEIEQTLSPGGTGE